MAAATLFNPLDRVVVKRSGGKVESWIVLHYLDGKVVVGREQKGQAIAKHVSPADLAAWQEKFAGQPVKESVASFEQIEVAFKFAELYAKQEGQG